MVPERGEVYERTASEVELRLPRRDRFEEMAPKKGGIFEFASGVSSKFDEKERAERRSR